MVVLGILHPLLGETTAQPRPVIVLVGDSTVASGSGWGDAFAGLLAPGSTCLNLARKGRSSKSYRDEGAWEKVMEAKPDWVLIQFGHNDQPGKGPKLETDASTGFRDNLERYVAEARASGARPVLVTSLTRRKFGPDGKIVPDLLVPYVEATRIVAERGKIPLIDLNAVSVARLNAIGPAEAVSYDAASKDPSKPDKTHLSEKGARETALLVAEQIRLHVPELAKCLKQSEGG